jgi:hypothetical protein
MISGVAHARPEYAIVLALIGVLLAIGVPSLQRGQLLVGSICTALAVLVACWAAVVMLRERRG